ncbi:hypothetical protein TSOC_003415 [Tetrabaena socialis]|uniref:Plastid lipid-associated protein/fibrillin conserved domain-containing protein n=1 Tax=Tetrabaena socialis TaxID=47790 RepID=A0A2J8ABP3_9CHLO|nr:hypothetical protein TSOC_003415 [Tetrabaena socialis]|eukprot:PNH09940.1 hypothetical protein TSOC_003415 [Tetrabaena socialis]
MPQDSEFQLAEEKKELELILNRIGFPASVLPGEEETKEEVDLLIRRLEALTPVPQPLQQPGGLPGVNPLLLGEWQLVYASNGTVVTRSAPAQLLLQASQLPGVGLSDIMQVLSLSESGSLMASNSAVFGFGPLGSWRVGIEGLWRNSGDGMTARVLFDRVSVRPVAALGLPLPGWLPPLKIAAGGSSGPGEKRSGADWVTTFVDGTMRVGRGKTGNTFLFKRKVAP